MGGETLAGWKSLHKKYTFRLLNHRVGGPGHRYRALIQEYWRDEGSLHINIKELRAAMASVQALAKEGEIVNLSVDNAVSYYYLKKGGGNCPISTPS